MRTVYHIACIRNRRAQSGYSSFVEHLKFRWPIIGGATRAQRDVFFAAICRNVDGKFVGHRALWPFGRTKELRSRAKCVSPPFQPKETVATFERGVMAFDRGTVEKKTAEFVSQQQQQQKTSESTKVWGKRAMDILIRNAESAMLFS
jgi:hypothetical protein